MKVYLAGPIQGYTKREVLDWRREASGVLEPAGIEVRNPLRGKLMHIGDNDIVQGSYEGIKHSTAAEVYRRDIEDVEAVDFIIANFTYATHPSIGTIYEIGYAMGMKFVDRDDSELGPYVISVVTSGSVHDHVFIQYGSDMVCNDLGEALDHVQEAHRKEEERLAVDKATFDDIFGGVTLKKGPWRISIPHYGNLTGRTS